jgi:hypothetical protein
VEAPIFVLRDLAAYAEAPAEVRARDQAPVARSRDIIDEGLLSLQDAVYFLKMSVVHYARNEKTAG